MPHASGWKRARSGSYEVDSVGALWHADFHDGSRKVLTKRGELVTPQLFGCIDDHSRVICHLQWYTNEDTETFVHGMSQAFLRRGLCRALMTDNGPAMILRGIYRRACAPGYLAQPDARVLCVHECEGRIVLGPNRRPTHGDAAA